MEQFEMLEMVYHLPAGQDTYAFNCNSFEIAAIAIGDAIEESLDGIVERNKERSTFKLTQQHYSLDELIYLELKSLNERRAVPNSLAAKALAAEIDHHFRKYYFN